MQKKITKIYLASDHAGFELKEKVKLYLENIKKVNFDKKLEENNLNINFEIVDLGASKYDEADDYTDYIHKAGHALCVDSNSGYESGAIVFGGSGQGEAMVMNRYYGVRCTAYYGGNLEIVKLGREHNDANSISFGSRFIKDDECFEAVKLFLNIDFEGGRHEIRVKKIDHKFGFLSRFFS